MDPAKILKAFLLAIILPRQVSIYASSIATSGTSPCEKACSELLSKLPSTAVTTFQPPNLYWAQQQSELQATCYASPSSASEVSTVLLTAKKYQCNLAIRGGGHSDVPGASNINDGLVLNLGFLKEFSVDQHRETVRIGAGYTWGEVYSTLDQWNMTTSGGREPSVGVAGLILGGGISFFSGTRGFVCDTVKSFEAVLADGRIVQISNESHYRDLFRALKGGANNFAVVTAFEIDVFKYNGILGGLTAWTDSPQVALEVTEGFVQVSRNAPSAPHANIFISIGYSPTGYSWLAGLSYTLPELRPAIFEPFYSSNLSSVELLNTQRISTHSDLVVELGTTQPANFRNQFTTATFVSDAQLQLRMVEILKEEVASATPKMSTLEGFAPGISFQPLTENMLSHSSRRGGNSLGVTANEAPLMLASFLWQWSSSVDDTVVLAGIQNVLDRSSAIAREMGLLNEFVYQNYAAPKQDPIPSYGAQNRAFLQRVSRKYDPEGVFQKLVPGGFKLF